MGKDPAFLFYSQDFLTGVMLMNDDQVGKYVRILCIMHQKGRITHEHMLKICKSYDDDIFEKFETDKDGMYYNKRLETEVDRRKAYSKSRRNNRLKKSTQITYVQHMETETETIDSNKGGVGEKEEDWQIAAFDEFWMAYQKKDDKVRARKAFNKISKTQFEAIMKHVPKYVAATPEKQFRKLASTYLNGENWNDEVGDGLSEFEILAKKGYKGRTNEEEMQYIKLKNESNDK